MKKKCPLPGCDADRTGEGCNGCPNYPTIHFLAPGADLTRCGRAGRKLVMSADPKEMTCGTCKKSIQLRDGVWSVLVKFTQGCSGCSCDCGGGMPCGHGSGGCEECGFTGKRRWEGWIPLNPDDALQPSATKEGDSK